MPSTKETKALSDFVISNYNRVSEIHSGSHTLNELRIEHAIGRAVSQNLPISNAAVAESLGMSRSTVSRAILGLIERGVVTESIDPEDRRRRILNLTVFGEQLVRDWIDWCNDMADSLGIRVY